MNDFPEEIENEFKEMAFVLENAERGCWVFAVYNQASARAQIIGRLQTELKLPFFTWRYSDSTPYPIDYLRDLSEEQKQQRALVSFINTTEGGDKTIKSLDFNREKFAEYPHSLIFWVTENDRGEIARKAGHFWAQRRASFNFSKLVLSQSDQIQSYGMGEWLNNLLNIDNYQEALRQLDFYQKLLTEYETVGESTQSTQQVIAEIADKISYLLYYLGRYSEAIGYCQKALSFYRALLGENDYSTVAASNNLVLIHLLNGQYNEAKPQLPKVLSMANFTPASAKATILNNLVAFYYCEGNYEAAESLCKKTLKFEEEVLGKDCSELGISLNSLAFLYQKQGKYAEAKSLYQGSLAILEKNLGKDHSTVAATLNNFASLYDAEADYAQAEFLYQRSLAIREKALGKEHPDVASSLKDLAALYYAQGKYGQAESLYKRSLAIFEKALGVEHPNTKQVKANYEQLLAEKVEVLLENNSKIKSNNQ